MKNRILQIAVPQGDEASEGQTWDLVLKIRKKEFFFEQFLRNFHQAVKGRLISLEILGLEQYTYLYMVVPEDLYETVEGLLYSTFPTCEIKETEDYASAAGMAALRRAISGQKIEAKKLMEESPEGEGMAAAVLPDPSGQKYPLSHESKNQTKAIVEKNEHDPHRVVDIHQDALPVAGCFLRCMRSDIYPFIMYPNMEDDSMASLLSIISKTNPEDKVWVQILCSARNEDAWYHLQRRIRIWKNKIVRFFRVRNWIKSKGKNAIFEEEKESFDNKMSIPPFHCEIKIGYVGKDMEDSKRKLNSVVNTFYQFNKTDFQEFMTGRKVNGKEFERMYRRRTYAKSTYTFCTKEIATLYHFPNPYSVAHCVHVQAKKAEPPMDLPKIGQKDVAYIGTTNYHNNFITFGIKDADRRRHLYAVGKSGSGKSKLLELLIRENLIKGQGVGVLDPHGDLVDNVMQYVPKSRVKDVVYFDPGDVKFPIAFNPLEAVEDEYKMQVTIGFIQIFKKLFGSNWTDRLEHVLRYTTLALLDSPNTTVLSILKMLTDKNYRQTIVSRISDSVVKNFWVSEFAGWSEKFDAEAITPLLNKVGQFVSTNMIRNIIAQPRSKFEITDIMNNEKILFMKVSKGLLGEENSALIGSMIITKIYQAAMARAAIREEERKDFYLYVDEFQNFATDTFSEILSEARKYGLCLTIAHQYMGQLSPLIQKTVFGNCGTILNFRVGSEDSVILEKEYVPVFRARDIINLGVREFYIKMSVNGEIREAFSGRTLGVPKVTEEDDHTKAIVNHSREKYSIPIGDVEKLQKRWDEASEDETGAPEMEVDFAPPII